MLVRDIMKSPVTTIEPNTSLAEANGMCWELGIRHLPVMEGKRLVGLVTDRDIRFSTSPFAPVLFGENARVEEVMIRAVFTADPLDPVEDAARVMREHKIGCLPVLEGKRLTGIITGIDLLDALLIMAGVHSPSGRIEVLLENQPGELARLTAFFGEKKLNILSILTYVGAEESVHTVLRIGSLSTLPLAGELRQRGFVVVWPPDKPWSR